jgi:ParB-like chromosome segregation protein Spo0J
MTIGVKTPAEIQALVMKKAGKGVAAACYFLQGRVKEVISVPAPRVKLHGHDGAAYYVAGWEKNMPGITTRLFTGSRLVKDKKTGIFKRRSVTYERSYAKPGAPPRKLSGRLRTSIAVEVQGKKNAAIGRVGTNVVYALPLELGGHPFLVPTLRQYLTQIRTIVSGRI